MTQTNTWIVVILSYGDLCSSPTSAHFVWYGKVWLFSTFPVLFLDKSIEGSDRISDSSGVCTSASNSGSNGSQTGSFTGSYDHTPTDNGCLILPGMMVVCTEDYNPDEDEHLQILRGDIIEGKPVRITHNLFAMSVSGGFLVCRKIFVIGSNENEFHSHCLLKSIKKPFILRCVKTK